MYLRSGIKASKPRFAKVLVSMKNTPIGAKLITRFVISIIRSLNWLKKFATSSALSPIFARRIPTIRANTITCSIFPFANELNGLSGMISSRVSTAEVFSATVTFSASIRFILSPIPGLMRAATDIATVTAIAVVAR